MFSEDPLEGNVEFVPYIEEIIFVAIRADGQGHCSIAEGGDSVVGGAAQDPSVCPADFG